jgi:hypothetical protein
MRLEQWVDAWSAIGDLKLYASRFDMNANLYGREFRRVLDRVCEQIDEHLPKPAFVSHNISRSARQIDTQRVVGVRHRKVGGSFGGNAG